MGQMAVGILYGCEAPKIAYGSDCEIFYDIIEKFNQDAKIDWESPKVRLEGDDNKILVGVWVAVGGSGEDGAPFFVEECFPVDQINIVYKNRIDEAKKLWVDFVKYMMSKHDIKLPTATLWITTCEVA